MKYRIGFSRRKFIWYKPASYGSWFIRTMLGFAYSHSYFVLNDVTIIESTLTGGVHLTDYTHFKDYITEEIEIETDVDVYPRIQEILRKKYDILSVLQHFIYLITGKWFFKINHDKFMCSESVSFILNKPEYWKYTPKTLYEEYKNN